MFKLVQFAILVVTAVHVAAHGAMPSPAEVLARRELNEIAGRSLHARCAAVLAKRKATRMRKRAYSGLQSFNKRQTNESLCILTPEVTQGPYHILGELIRQNITEEQAGVPLELDVDFFDVETCAPVPNVWVDGWQANATGYYSGYEQESAEANSGSATGSGTQPGTLPSATGTGPTADADDPSDILTDAPSDTDTFLRGVWQADESGHLTMNTIVPGWYSGRSVHFHLKVYTEGNGSIADNGTFVAGSAVHTGQFFFSEEFVQTVGNVTPYNTNTVERLTNDDDIWYAYQNAYGYTADMDVALVDESDVTAGAIGSISVGLNVSFLSPEISPFWWDGNSASSSSLIATESASI